VLGDPLTRYEGTLKDILPTPEKVNDAIFYYARFEVPNPQGILRLDMTAQVHIQLAEVKNVITIPLSALGDAIGDNRYHVRLLRTGEVKEREVVIGARNDTDVAVVKGLEEGDEVIVGEGASRSGKMTALLELRDIRRSYPSGDGSVEVLKGITLSIAAGEMVAIVGASGSGNRR
jgi:macrolide-specific efflux system membrane fusion protein